MITPNVPREDGRYPSPAYLEGYYGLPDGSLSGNEPLDVSMGRMTEDVYMGYLGMALKLSRRKLRETKRNETVASRPTHETKRNETDKILCLCGCGREITQAKTGRTAKFSSSACRVRYHRSKRK
jgi:hypothetical protein